MGFIVNRSDGAVWRPEAGGYVKNGIIVSTIGEWTTEKEKKEYDQKKSSTSSKSKNTKKTYKTSSQEDELEELREELLDMKKNQYKQNKTVETIDKISPLPIAEIFQGANMENVITVGVGLLFFSLITSIFRR